MSTGLGHCDPWKLGGGLLVSAAVIVLACGAVGWCIEHVVRWRHG